MTAAATPDTRARAFVARLLRTNDPERRRALIAHPALSTEETRDAVHALIAEAVGLIGVNPVRMERICDDALALAQRVSDEYGAALALLRHADALRAQGRYAEAIPQYDEAWAVFKRLDRPVDAAGTRTGWIECTAALGRVPEALAVARQARRTFAEHGELTRAATLENTVGRVYAQLGRLGAALRCFSRALQLYRNAGQGDSVLAARMHQNRGAMLSQLGRHSEALRELGLARQVFESAGEAAGLARMTLNQGLNYVALGRYATGLRTLEAALQQFRALVGHLPRS